MVLVKGIGVPFGLGESRFRVDMITAYFVQGSFRVEFKERGSLSGGC